METASAIDTLREDTAFLKAIIKVGRVGANPFSKNFATTMSEFLKNYTFSTDRLVYPSFPGKSDRRLKPKQKQKQKEHGTTPRGRPKRKESPTRRSIDLFWDIVGRNNYTTSLNSANVVCNTSSPPEKFDFFQTAAKKFQDLSWRSKPSPRREPTMVAHSDDRSLALVTTVVTSRSSSLASPTITSNTFFDWDLKDPIDTLTPPETVDPVIKEDNMPEVQLVGRKPDTEPVLDENVAEQVRRGIDAAMV
jgi:hypothetical protein